MAIIKIQRKNDFGNRNRSYKIFINDELQGTLTNNETKEFTVSTTDPQLTVRATVDWCSSPDLILNVAKQQTKQLEVGSIASKYSPYFVLFTFVIVAISFAFTKKFDPQLMVIFIVPALLFLIYILTWGRKKYLTIKEVKSDNGN